jgi:hypothetical protein
MPPPSALAQRIVRPRRRSTVLAPRARSRGGIVVFVFFVFSFVIVSVVVVVVAGVGKCGCAQTKAAYEPNRRDGGRSFMSHDSRTTKCRHPPQCRHISVVLGYSDKQHINRDREERSHAPWRIIIMMSSLFSTNIPVAV